MPLESWLIGGGGKRAKASLPIRETAQHAAPRIRVLSNVGSIELSIRLIRLIRLPLFGFPSFRPLRGVLGILRVALFLVVLGLGRGSLGRIGFGRTIGVVHCVLRCSEFAAMGRWHSKGAHGVRQMLDPSHLRFARSRSRFINTRCDKATRSTTRPRGPHEEARPR